MLLISYIILVVQSISRQVYLGYIFPGRRRLRRTNPSSLCGSCYVWHSQGFGQLIVISLYMDYTAARPVPQTQDSAQHDFQAGKQFRKQFLHPAGLLCCRCMDIYMQVPLPASLSCRCRMLSARTSFTWLSSFFPSAVNSNGFQL